MGRCLIAGASRIECFDEKKLKERTGTMEAAISKKDIVKLDEEIAEIKAADIEPEFKRLALEIYRDSKALAIEMIPYFLRAEKISERVTEILGKYPQFKKYL